MGWKKRGGNKKWQATSEEIKFLLGFVIRLHQSNSYVLIWVEKNQLLGVYAWGPLLYIEPDSLHNEQFLFNQDLSTDSAALEGPRHWLIVFILLAPPAGETAFSREKRIRGRVSKPLL